MRDMASHHSGSPIIAAITNQRVLSLSERPLHGKHSCASSDRRELAQLRSPDRNSGTQELGGTGRRGEVWLGLELHRSER